MSASPLDVVGIGNAIVDILAQCDDAFLKAHGSEKGFTTLCDAETVTRLYEAAGPTVEASGGSAANTIVGVAGFGGTSAYIGKVAEDEFGRIFQHDIRAAGVTYETVPKSGGAPTARSLILVTPDGERTMHTFLGVSPELDGDDIDADLIARAKILYLEGYLFDRPQAQEAFYRAAAIARDAGRKVALTLSDGFCVDRHRSAFRDIIKSEVDILFANKAEILSLFETDSFEGAVANARDMAPITAITQSEDGSVLSRDGEIVEVPAVPVAPVVDSTGAGDLYASGVLYGLSRDLPLATCGQLGSLAASETIGQIGARPRANLKEKAQDAGLSLG
ncbi:MAG: adenosine kinase [Pseudomonadota bacterium]